MPIITSNFAPPRSLRNNHLQTILPAIARRVEIPTSPITTLRLEDGDSITIRLRKEQGERLAIISHGLEGSFDSTYVKGMSNALAAAGWDVLSWNMRGCGGEPNELVTWYHSGQSEDLRAVVRYALGLPYSEISLVGFSVGGNITLKYLGEEGHTLSKKISCAVAVSVPMDLRGSAEQLAKKANSLYMQYLLRPLRRRMRQKKLRFPNTFDLSGLDRIKTFREFDARFTAPFHGFSSVDEYWERSSSLHYLSYISVHTLAISALDDPFLSQSCLPSSIAHDHHHLFFESPSHGGHVGFFSSLKMSKTWLEGRVVEFLEWKKTTDQTQEDPVKAIGSARPNF